jgi:hypothetical protein
MFSLSQLMAAQVSACSNDEGGRDNTTAAADVHRRVGSISSNGGGGAASRKKKRTRKNKERETEGNKRTRILTTKDGPDINQGNSAASHHDDDDDVADHDSAKENAVKYHNDEDVEGQENEENSDPDDRPQLNNCGPLIGRYTEILRTLYGNEQRRRSDEQPKPTETLEVIRDALDFPFARDHPMIPRGISEGGGGDDDDYRFNVDKYDAVGRYDARRVAVVHRRRGPKTGGGAFRSAANNFGGERVTYRLETPEEIEVRVRRMDRSQDRTKFAARWKRRRVNVQAEDDVGNAFAARAERHLRETLQRERRHRGKAARRAERENRIKEEEERKSREKEEHEADVLEEDDSVHEQSQLFERFTQNVEAEEKKDALDGVPPHLDPSVPFRAQFRDYWEFGYAVPRKEDLPYNYNPKVAEMLRNVSKQSFSHSVHEEPKSRQNASVGFWSLVCLKKEGSSNFFYFPPNDTVVTNASTTFRPSYNFGHIRQMMIMAARSLCGGPGDMSLENRHLRLLCSVSEVQVWESKGKDGFTVSNFRDGRFLHSLAEERGRDMLLYARSEWSNPVEAAKGFGIFSCRQDIPIAGNLLNRINMQSMANRTRVARSFRKGSRDWMPSDAAVDVDDNHEDMDCGEGSTAPCLRETFPDIPTSGGIRDVTVNVSNATTNNLKAADPSEVVVDALLAPNSLYVHIPLTSPPIPDFPLDPSSIIFGPVDRHARFYHGSVKIGQPYLQTHSFHLDGTTCQRAPVECIRRRTPDGKADRNLFGRVGRHQ